MKRILRVLCAAALVCALLPIGVSAVKADEFQITEQKLQSREDGLDIKGSYPLVAGIGNASLEAAVNEKIDTVFQQKKAEAKDSKAKSMTFAYTVTESGGITSILLRTVINTATTKREVNSVNFSRSLQSWIQIDDPAALGPNAVSLANKVISQRIKDNPDEYYQNFPGITKDDAFVVEDNGVSVYFDSGKVAPGADGEISFLLESQCVTSYWLPSDRYIVDAANYNLRMIPLRMVAENLGYTVTWTPGDVNTLIVVSRSDDFMATLTIGANNYSVSGPSAPDKPVSRQLEAAPELVDGVTYVPVSFFDQILELVSFSIDSDGGITFSTYLDQPAQGVLN